MTTTSAQRTSAAKRMVRGGTWHTLALVKTLVVSDEMLLRATQLESSTHDFRTLIWWRDPSSCPTAIRYMDWKKATAGVYQQACACLWDFLCWTGGGCRGISTRSSQQLYSVVGSNTTALSFTARASSASTTYEHALAPDSQIA